MYFNKYLFFYFAFSVFPILISTHVSRIPSTFNIGAIVSKFLTDGTANPANGQGIAAIMLALGEINNRHDLLPHTKLKIALYSSEDSYVGVCNSAIDIKNLQINNTGVKAVIGGYNDLSTQASAKIFANSIFQLSYGATSVDLSSVTDYPSALQMSIPRFSEGFPIAELINHFGWTKVTIFYTADSFGTDLITNFLDIANTYNINIQSRYVLWPGSDFSFIFPIVLGGQSGDGANKIFIILMNDPKDIGRLIEQGYEAGLFHAGVQIISTSSVASSAVWLEGMSTSANVKSLMNGVIGVYPTYNRDSSIYYQFVKAWRAQQPTYTITTTGSKQCSTKKDAIGNYIFQGYANSTTSHLSCVELNFSAFSSSGTDIYDSVLNAYDSVYVLAHALHILYYDMNATTFTSQDILKVVVNNVSFHGASGAIGFDPTGIGSLNYGYGSRENGTQYKIVNFDPAYYNSTNRSISGNTLRTILLWDAASGFSPCNPTFDVECTTHIAFSSTDNSQPFDTPVIVEIQMSYSSRLIIRIATAFVLLVLAYFTGVVFAYKKHRLIKAAQPGMLLVMLFGALLACIKAIITTVDITDGICITGTWLGHLSFALVFGALILKIWRVNKLVRSRLKKVKVPVEHLQRILSVIMTTFCCLLILHTILASPHRSYEETSDDKTSTRLIKCATKFSTITQLLYAIEVLVLVYGAYQCWLSKGVPEAVNDSGSVAISLYLIVFVCAICFPIVYLSIDPTPENLLIVMAVGFIVSAFGSMIVLLGFKSYLLITGVEVTASYNIVRSQRSQSQRRRSSLGSRSMAFVSKMFASRYQDNSDKLNNMESIPEENSHPNQSQANRSSLGGGGGGGTTGGAGTGTGGGNSVKLQQSHHSKRENNNSGLSEKWSKVTDHVRSGVLGSTLSNNNNSNNISAAKTEKSERRRLDHKPSTGSARTKEKTEKIVPVTSNTTTTIVINNNNNNNVNNVMSFQDPNEEDMSHFEAL